MRRAEGRHRWPRLLWVGLLLLPLVWGCNPPCKKLGLQICKSLPKQKKLCEIALQECQQKEATYRRCSALAETWSVSGENELVAFAKRYQKYHDWVARQYKMHRGLELMAIEHKRFRRLLRKILQLPTQKTASTNPPKRPAPAKR